MADITVKKKSLNLFLLLWSAEQGQWKIVCSKVWHSNLIPTFIGLLGAPFAAGRTPEITPQYMS